MRRIDANNVQKAACSSGFFGSVLTVSINRGI